MPVKQNSIISFFDGPTIMSAAGYCVHEGNSPKPWIFLTSHSGTRSASKASKKTLAIREQGFLTRLWDHGMDELEYTGVMENLKRLNDKFVVQEGKNIMQLVIARSEATKQYLIDVRSPRRRNGLAMTH